MHSIRRSLKRRLNKIGCIEHANRYQWDTKLDDYSDDEEELLDYEFAGVDDYEEEQLIAELEAMGYDIDNLDAGPNQNKGISFL
jgi:hypothetical protein